MSRAIAFSAPAGGSRHFRKRVQFFPIRLGFVQARGGHLTQDAMMLRQSDRPPARFERFEVPFADSFHAQLRVAPHVGQQRAGSQAYQVVGVGQAPCLVEIVDAPDQAAFDIPPGAEVLDVQISHRQRFGRARRVAAHFLPDLRPAVIGCAQEGKDGGTHLLVLERQVFIHDAQMATQPRFISSSSFGYFHIGTYSR